MYVCLREESMSKLYMWKNVDERMHGIVLKCCVGRVVSFITMVGSNAWNYVYDV